MSTGVCWFRRDLRLDDNPAWADATSRHDRVVAVFVVEAGLWDRCHPRRRSLLAGHLASLDTDLRGLGAGCGS